MSLVLNLADNSNQACSRGNGPCDIMTPKSEKKIISQAYPFQHALIIGM